ncbi:P22 phage major capsid protein family protein, partial [Salmonella enterica]|uniref:P22 phage major capsid protein family protein n=1 Tax=Salmonella enterica TaxID=28901 RepID=UPI00398C7E83
LTTYTLFANSCVERRDKTSFTVGKILCQVGKSVLAHDETCSDVRCVDGTHVEPTPKPVALDDVSLSPAQRAYANVNTSLADAMAVNILNVKYHPPNVFCALAAIRFFSHPIPSHHHLFAGSKPTPLPTPAFRLHRI